MQYASPDKNIFEFHILKTQTAFSRLKKIKFPDFIQLSYFSHSYHVLFTLDETHCDRLRCKSWNAEITHNKIELKIFHLTSACQR